MADALTPETVEPLLSGRFGRPYLYEDTCESTQQLLDSRARGGRGGRLRGPDRRPWAPRQSLDSASGHCRPLLGRARAARRSAGSPSSPWSAASPWPRPSRRRPRWPPRSSGRTTCWSTGARSPACSPRPPRARRARHGAQHQPDAATSSLPTRPSRPGRSHDRRRTPRAGADPGRPPPAARARLRPLAGRWARRDLRRPRRAGLPARPPVARRRRERPGSRHRPQRQARSRDRRHERRIVESGEVLFER